MNRDPTSAVMFVVTMRPATNGQFRFLRLINEFGCVDSGRRQATCLLKTVLWALRCCGLYFVDALILISTPAGRLSLFKASIVLAVA